MVATANRRARIKSTYALLTWPSIPGVQPSGNTPYLRHFSKYQTPRDPPVRIVGRTVVFTDTSDSDFRARLCCICRCLNLKEQTESIFYGLSCSPWITCPCPNACCRCVHGPVGITLRLVTDVAGVATCSVQSILQCRKCELDPFGPY